jgi:hypothetical protein
MPVNRIGIPEFPDGLLKLPRLSDHRSKGRRLLSSSGKDMPWAMVDVLPKRSKQRLEARTEVAKWPIRNGNLKDEHDQDLVSKTYSSASSELCGVGSLFPAPYEVPRDLRASSVSLGSTPEVDSPGEVQMPPDIGVLLTACRQ